MKTTPIRPLSTCLILTAILLLAGISHGQLINVNFTGGTAETHSALSGPATVLSSDTRPFWRSAAVSPADQGYHWNWNAESYFLIGKTLGDDMVDLLTP